jgi:hypothetical protein
MLAVPVRFMVSLLMPSWTERRLAVLADRDPRRLTGIAVMRS